MARPATKIDLIESANLNYDKLLQVIDGMTDEEENSKLEYGDFIGKEVHWNRDKNLRNILIHLYEWHNLLLEWVDSNINGVGKQFLRDGYNWRTYGDMNIEIWKEYQSTSL